MALEAAMQTGARELWDAVVQAAEHVVERQQCSAAELDDHGFLGRGQDGAVGRSWSHWRIIGRSPGAPLGDSGPAQAVALGQGAGRFFRRLELGSNSRRCSG